MTAKPFVANRLIGVRLKFRDAVSEICGGFSELLANQHALRVESGISGQLPAKVHGTWKVWLRSGKLRPWFSPQAKTKKKKHE